MAILSDAVAKKLESQLSNMPSWKSLNGSQFVRHLGIFLEWAIQDAAFKTERARQEAFIDTALNRSSILAHGEGMEFMPRKPQAPKGKALVTNQGEYPVTLLREREYMNDAQVIYTALDTITVEPGESQEVEVEQRTRDTLEFEVTETKPFYEILLGRDISRKIINFRVYVSEDGETYTEWKYDRLLTNAYTDTLVFDEFYHFTDQIGIRFGNGDFGKVIPAGAKVRVEVVETEGDTILLEKQSLWPIEEVTDSMGQPGNVQIVISETVQNGANQETTEEMRRDLHYAPVYNDRLVWDNDFKFFLRRRFPDIVFAVAWGEEEAEKMWGYNIEHINRIWICAYSPKRDVQALCMEAVRNSPFMCRNFVWYEPEHVQFSVRVEGRVLKDCYLSEAIESVRNALLDAYGAESANRREVVRVHEVYDTIYNTGYFDRDSGAWFEIQITGQPRADLIYQMVSIDMDACVFDIQYRE